MAEDEVKVEAVVEAAEAAEEVARETIPLTVTSASEWRRKARARWLVTLPSGATVKAKRPDWQKLVLEGVLSQEQLLGLAQSVQGDREKYDAIVFIGYSVLPHIIVEPVVVQANGHAPADDAEVIAVDQIPDGDLVSVLLWAVGRSALPAQEVDG